MKQLMRVQRRIARSLSDVNPFLRGDGRILFSTDTNESDTREMGVPRFYKSVSIRKERDGFQILLDTRLLRTPAKKPLVVPTRALALAIAAEWEWQKRKIQPFTMPLMSLAAIAIDLPKPRPSVIATMLQYLPTDSVVCRSEAGTLADTQEQAYAPALKWAKERLSLLIEPTDSIFGAKVHEEETQKVENHLKSLDDWHLAAAEQLAASCKSVLLALATVDGVLGVEEAFNAARLEEDYNIQRWGLVEGGHDIDIADIKVRVAAPVVFLSALRRS